RHKSRASIHKPADDRSRRPTDRALQRYPRYWPARTYGWVALPDDADGPGFALARPPAGIFPNPPESSAARSARSASLRECGSNASCRSGHVATGHQAVAREFFKRLISLSETWRTGDIDETRVACAGRSADDRKLFRRSTTTLSDSPAQLLPSIL